MLVEFRVANYKSIREEQVLSMVASSERGLPDNCINDVKPKLLKTSVIFGPNASGKSNVFEAIQTMKMIILNSSLAKDKADFPITPFRFDDSSNKEPSLFEIVFIHKKTRYQYGFKVTTRRVIEEWLYAYPLGVSQKWFERSYNSENKKYNFKFSTLFKGNKVKMQEMTRSDSLYLSIGAILNNEQLINVYNWFKFELRIIFDDIYIKGVTEEMLHTMIEDEVVRKTIVLLLKKADFGIQDFIIKKENIEMPPFVSELNDGELKKMLVSSFERLSYKVEFIHKYGMDKSLTWNEESKGTQQFFQYLGPFLQCIFEGKTLIVDELDRSLHPLLINELISAFNLTNVNRKGAQLIFNTHNTIFLNPELFRRDQIWFTEKNNEGATNLYSLSEYKPRKGEALQKGYLAGRYGAIPIIERFNIDGVEKGEKPEKASTT